MKAAAAAGVPTQFMTPPSTSPMAELWLKWGKERLASSQAAPDTNQELTFPYIGVFVAVVLVLSLVLGNLPRKLDLDEPLPPPPRQ
mmetsp:Transcript_88394/g.286219  ORF Transcript_88394/g.286219 Transcript_88394/m.286219 type:complete len:86 (+) Transcript_88394:1-258(+)